MAPQPNKLTIKDMRRTAAERGGKCLSTVYVNANSKLTWQCSEGHVWKATPSDVKQGKWCRTCAGLAPHTLEEMQELARSRGGTCLSKKYVNNTTKLEWQCSEGHVWESTPGNIGSGRWCPVCAGNTPLSIDEMRSIAAERGGKCLSREYVNSQARLKWRCSEGHEWEASASSIKQGSWCARCAGKARLTIEEIQLVARSKGGHCLSDTYTNNKTPLEWQCAEGHVWTTTFGSVRGGQWCPICGIRRRAKGRSKTIEEMRDLAAIQGGKCLSGEYSNTKTPLEWECAFGHRWEASPGSIIAGTWCPTCKSGASERVCRAAFEAIFSRPFPKHRPDWLNGLELDGYCEELAIAFEY